MNEMTAIKSRYLVILQFPLLLIIMYTGIADPIMLFAASAMKLLR